MKICRRAALLQQMENQYKDQKNKKKDYTVLADGAQKRNAKLIEDMQAMTDRLKARPLLHPDVVNLETRYWASVEEKIPEWEQFLLGKIQPPVDARKQVRQKGTSKDNQQSNRIGLPPRSGSMSVS
ncbi:centrosomal protein 15 isoform X2 [Amia ocellicauda]|uniref:centrosomal protein 15 isoform X2 n=1 Tax=Amia ocellicauda TaxID=2972642 RepID=UPI003464C9CB